MRIISSVLIFIKNAARWKHVSLLIKPWRVEIKIRSCSKVTSALHWGSGNLPKCLVGNFPEKTILCGGIHYINYNYWKQDITLNNLDKKKKKILVERSNRNPQSSSLTDVSWPPLGNNVLRSLLLPKQTFMNSSVRKSYFEGCISFVQTLSEVTGEFFHSMTVFRKFKGYHVSLSRPLSRLSSPKSQSMSSWIWFPEPLSSMKIQF